MTCRLLYGWCLLRAEVGAKVGAKAKVEVGAEIGAERATDNKSPIFVFSLPHTVRAFRQSLRMRPVSEVATTQTDAYYLSCLLVQCSIHRDRYLDEPEHPIRMKFGRHESNRIAQYCVESCRLQSRFRGIRQEIHK